MNGLQRLAVAVAGVIALVALLAPIVITGRVEAVNEPQAPEKPLDVPRETPKVIPAPKAVALTEAQEAWIDRLQRCESGTDPTQVNEVDRDGTPSYYAFQFKPSTFRGLGVAYKVIPRGMTDKELMEAIKRTDIQRAIVAHMIGDKSVRWGYQFPDCVRKHIGMPPGAAGRLE